MDVTLQLTESYKGVSSDKSISKFLNLVAEKFIINYKPYSLSKNIKNNNTPINFCHKPLKIPSKI